MCVTTGMYLIYEFMQFCCHVDESWFVRHCPFVNTLRRHHTAHHNARYLKKNLDRRHVCLLYTSPSPRD